MNKYFLVSYHNKTGKDRTEIIVLTEEGRRKYSMVKHKASSLSTGFDSEEALREHNKIQKEPCKKCGALIKGSYRNAHEFVPDGICFNCNHWRGIERTKNHPRRFIIEGESYWMDDDGTGQYFKGCGGREFKVKRFGSDEVIVSHNMWNQGTIPPEWKEDIPDNAEFVR